MPPVGFWKREPDFDNSIVPQPHRFMIALNTGCIRDHLCSFCPVHSWLSFTFAYLQPSLYFNPPQCALSTARKASHSLPLPSIKSLSSQRQSSPPYSSTAFRDQLLEPSPVYHDPHIVFRRSNSGVRSSSQPLIPTKRLSARQHVTRQTNNHSSRPPLPVYQHQGLVQNHGLWRGPWQCLPHQKYRR
jgi:hypothetical protein